MPEPKKPEMEPDFEILLEQTEQAAEEEGITPQFLIELDAINEMRLIAEDLSAPICHYSTST